MTTRSILLCALAALATLAAPIKSYSQAESAGASIQAGVRDKGRIAPAQEQSGEQRIMDQAYRPRAARRLVQTQRIEKDKVEEVGTAQGAEGVDEADEETFAPSQGGGNKERRLLFGF